MQLASSCPAATLLGAWSSMCHVSLAFIDNHVLAYSLTPYFYPVFSARVIISKWQTKGLGAYLQVGTAWLASSVDSLSGHPPSLFFSILLSSAIAKNHPQIKLLALLTQLLFSLSHVSVGMVCEIGPSRRIFTFHYCQLISPPAALVADFSQPLAYQCRILLMTTIRQSAFQRS